MKIGVMLQAQEQCRLAEPQGPFSVFIWLGPMLYRDPPTPEFLQ